MTRHGRDCPDRCSLCLGAVPKLVEQRGADLVVDGVVIRQIAVEAWIPQVKKSQLKKGGRR